MHRGGYSVVRPPVSAYEYPLEAPRSNPFFAPPAINYTTLGPRPGGWINPPSREDSDVRELAKQLRRLPAREIMSLFNRHDAWHHLPGGYLGEASHEEMARALLLAHGRIGRSANPPQVVYGDEGEQAPSCPQCGGQGVSMGSLGASEWFRCRACGWDFSSSAPQRNPFFAPPAVNYTMLGPRPGGWINPPRETCPGCGAADPTTKHLMDEWLSMSKAHFGMFGGNADRSRRELAAVLRARGVSEIPNIFGPIKLENPQKVCRTCGRIAQIPAGLKQCSECWNAAKSKNPGPRSKKCGVGYHDFDAAGQCRRKGCDAYHHAGQGHMFGEDATAFLETQKREEQTKQKEFFHGEKNPQVKVARLVKRLRAAGLSWQRIVQELSALPIRVPSPRRKKKAPRSRSSHRRRRVA